MPIWTTDAQALDIRFLTSRERIGSDAMNPDPDCSAAYLILPTDTPAALEGHGLTCTTAAAMKCAWPQSTHLKPHRQNFGIGHR